MTPLDQMNGHPVFDAQPAPTLALDTDLRIRAVSRSYQDVSGREAEELVSFDIFEAFPDNPEDPDSDGTANLRTSLERVLRSGRPHNMWVQRYDVLDLREGAWVKRYWSPVNTPVLVDGKVIGVLHRVEDITPVQEDLRRVLEQYRAIMTAAPLTDAHARRFAEAARAFTASAADHQGLVDEVMHLRRALTSRATIDQAKGILVAERRCSPDEAFKILSGLSQDTNVRLADVAAALVYTAQGAGSDPR